MYGLHSQKIGEKHEIIRGAAWRIRNYNHCGVFEDGEYIYTTDKVDEKIPNADDAKKMVDKGEVKAHKPPPDQPEGMRRWMETMVG